MNLPVRMFEDHSTLVKLAREIAMDLRELPDILKTYGMDDETWERTREHPYFQQVLTEEIATWQGALNTSERVKIKAGAQLEDWMPELHARLHDAREALPAKIEGAKLLARLAGYGVSGADIKDEGTRFNLQIVINPGRTTTIDAPMKTIEGERLD